MSLSLNKPKLDNLAGDIWEKELLAQFWKLEKEAEKLLEGLAK
jgi:hypothetical protein